MSFTCLCIYFHSTSINKKWFDCPIPCQASRCHHFDRLLICLTKKSLVWSLIFFSFKIHPVVLNDCRYSNRKRLLILTGNLFDETRLVIFKIEMLNQFPWPNCTPVSCFIIHLRGFHSLKLIDFSSFYQPPHRTTAYTNNSSNFTRALMNDLELFLGTDQFLY